MAGFPVDGMDAGIPGDLPAPTRAEGVLPSEEEEAYYQSVGFPILVELLSKASMGSQMEQGMGQPQPQMMGQPAVGASPQTAFQHVRSRDAQGRPKPQSRLEATNNLLRAKRARVNNPGVPNLPQVAQIVNQRMAAGPQQMAPQRQMPQQAAPQQMAPRRPNAMQQARKPEIYQPLRQQAAPSPAPARPMQAFDPNQAS
tara:strand:- start:4472 stop:5068 length:597 start_codon:yes stop_codon:yes gene_type:complete